MKTTPLLLMIACCLAYFSAAQVPSNTTQALRIGDQIVFHSEILQQDRTLNIYLPYSYHPDSAQHYPVIYLLDGSLDEDFLHMSGLVQFESYSWINMLPECIVVGISNVDRKHDFTYPTRDKQDKIDFPTTGGSAAFMECLEKEIQVLIESKYKCNETRVLSGQSLGGLLASEILLKRPELFTHYLIVSPSLWWDKESLLEWPVPEAVKHAKVFIAVGAEGSVMIRTARSLHEKLKSHLSAPENLGFLYMPEHDHGDILHQAAYHGLAALFQMKKP